MIIYHLEIGFVDARNVIVMSEVICLIKGFIQQVINKFLIFRIIYFTLRIVILFIFRPSMLIFLLKLFNYLIILFLFYCITRCRMVLIHKFFMYV